MMGEGDASCTNHNFSYVKYDYFCWVLILLSVSWNIDGGPNKMTLAEAKEAYAKGEKIY